jgi:serine/threonine protein kinase/Tfp pilus assembly protein PilF
MYCWNITMIGKTISHYRIIEELGRGGMGLVYKAEDTKLNRTVALKFLPPELTHDQESKERFIREAQAASALQHNNICTIHDIDETPDGQLYIVMDCYEGETLKNKIKEKRLKTKDSINIAIQIAEGLIRAHEEGIVHRDIKPANIIITDRGEVKILDFGLAKLAGQAQLTKDSSTLGTVAYMSPEQIQGKEVDHRTDIWSLGIVLYEMLTGELPFKGDYEQAIIYAILNDELQLHDGLKTGISENLIEMVYGCLQKNPRDRYKSIQEFLDKLDNVKKGNNTEKSTGKGFFNKKNITLAAALIIIILSISIFLFNQSDDKKVYDSIAVLPLKNISGDPEQEYFCDGMTEEIINALTHIKDLRVIARTSSFVFKGTQEDIREIGRKLGVEHILEGNIRKAENKLRITVQLVKVTDGSYIWSEKYDREFEDVFAIQDEIALAIVDRLKIELLPSEKEQLIKRNTESIDAYHDYLKGHYFWNKRTSNGFEKSISYYLSALEKDPNFVLPYAGLADAYASLGWYDIRPKKEVFDTALTYALKALEIDDNDGQAHATMANYKAWCEFDWETAEKEYKLALKLNPSEAEIHHQLAHIFELRGLFDQAINEMQIAINLEPLTVNFNTCLGQILFYAGQSEKANQVLHTSIEIDSTYFWSYYWLARVYYAIGEVEEALRLLNKARTYPHIHTISLGTSGYIYAQLGHTDHALKILNRLMKMSEDQIIDPLYISWIYLGLTDWDNTFHYLDKAYQGLSSYLPMIKVDSLYDTLRSDTRFIELLHKMGLENEQ